MFASPRCRGVRVVKELVDAQDLEAALPSASSASSHAMPSGAVRYSPAWSVMMNARKRPKTSAAEKQYDGLKEAWNLLPRRHGQYRKGLR